MAGLTAVGRCAFTLVQAVVLMLVLVPPTIHFGVRPIPTAWIFGMAGILIAIHASTISTTIRKDILALMIVVLLFCCFVTIGGFYAGGISLDVLVPLFVGLGMVLFSYYVLGPWLASGDDPIGRIFHIYILATAIHSSLVIAFFVFPEIRMTLHPFVLLSPEATERLQSGFRSVGISASAGEALAVGKGIALFMLARLYLTRRLALTWVLTLGLVIGFALLLLNRTGQVIGIVGILFAMASSSLISRRTFITVTVVVLAISAILATAMFAPANTLPRAVERSLEPARTLITAGRIASRSTDALTGRMLFLPEEKIITGSGNYGRHESLSFIASDIGYVRLLFGGGVIAIAFWIVLVSLMTVMNARASEVRSLARFLATVWVLANFKVLWILPLEAPTVALGLLAYLKSSVRNDG